MCFLHKMEKLCTAICVRVFAENMVNLIPEWLVWRLYAASVKNDVFMEILWNLSGDCRRFS